MDTLRTLTVVKTDIRRFTDRVQQMTSGELDAFLREHRALVHHLFGGFGGTIIKEIGDSYLVTFASSTNALLACIALQREMSRATAGQNPSEHTEIRIAVSAGDVLLQENDIFGTPVNAVARVEALTPPGEIYFTEAVYQNLNRNEVACEYVATFPLKGLSEEARVYRTTFRHQTRMMLGAAVMFTDIIGFTAFAETADLAEVEDLIDSRDAMHRQIAVEHGGSIRMRVADSYMLSFDTIAHAAAAWLDLVRHVARFNRTRAKTFPIRFSAGADVGDIRIFRSAVFGSAVIRANALTMLRPPDVTALALDERLLATLGDGLRGRWERWCSGDPEVVRKMAERAARLGITGIACLVSANDA